MKITYKKDSRNPKPEWTATLVLDKPRAAGSWPRGEVARTSEIASIFGPESKQDEQPYLVDMYDVQHGYDKPPPWIKDIYFDTLAEAKAHVELKCFERLASWYNGEVYPHFPPRNPEDPLNG